jgi:Peptidase S46
MWTLLLITLLADEGMWPYNQFPKDKANVTQEFLDNLRLASVQIAGGSGSFVSPNGLILTNQHLVTSCLGDRAKDGFYGEQKCPGLSANVLMSIEDVSAQVKGKLPERTAAIARIEKGCACSVVKLFAGGRYDLYHYKSYTDIRLVFAPEQQLAFFGRERDSITYLRYGLDVAFLRAYENDKPAATPHFLKWSTDGVKEGDFVFASGNPAPTARSTTAAQLTFYRDTALPLTLNRLMARIKVLPEGPLLTSLLSEYKIAAGKLIGLRDDRLVARKTLFEGKIRHTVERDPALGMAGGKVWDEVATAYKNWAPFERSYQILAGSPMISEPVLAVYLEELQKLNDKDVPMKKILDGKTPQQAAQEYVKTHTVDNLIELLEPAAKKIRKKHDEMLEISAIEKIAQYRYRLFGAAEYPDATSTPRVEFGTAKGYLDRAGVPNPYAATFSGLYYRVNDQGPYSVPKRWVDARASLSVVTPLDFVSTCDIGSGDYGSPVVNRAGELVGVTFDGNLESLPDTYLYTSEGARAVHVAAQGIVEALDKVYKAAPLLRELGIRSGEVVSVVQ